MDIKIPAVGYSLYRLANEVAEFLLSTVWRYSTVGNERLKEGRRAEPRKGGKAANLTDSMRYSSRRRLR